MGKDEVLEYLKKHKGKWIMGIEIKREINVLSFSSTGVSLKKLYLDGTIKRKAIAPKVGGVAYLYKYK